MSDVQVPSLQWPSFCYSAPALFDDESPARGLKRKAEEAVCVSPSSVSSEEEQKVPDTRDLFPRESLGSPELKPDFVFSNLMKRMAAKYQQTDSPAAVGTSPSLAFPILHLPHLFGQSAMSSSQLLAAMAQAHQPAKRCRLEEQRPLDLSPRSSELCYSPVQEIVDVVSVCPESPRQLDRLAPLQDWSVSQVSHFVESLDNCSEYSQVFEEHKIDGASLSVLTETHLTTILGLKLGPAAKIVSEVRKKTKN